MKYHGHKKSKIKRTIIIICTFIILIAASLILYYYLIHKNTNTPPNKPTPAVPKEPEIVKKLTIYNEDSNARPIAIMIDNNIGNNFHSGLQDSYLNYEIIVEGGLTRIMAIYKDKELSQIGPVRSARHYFIDYALESDCIYTHFGWSPYAENDIKVMGVNNINGLYDSYPFWRATHIYAPHNVFTSTTKLYEYAASKGYATETSNWKLLRYSVDEINLDKPIGYETIENPETGKKEQVAITNKELITANNLEMSYSYYQTRGYAYDPNNKFYLRYMNGQPHIDADSKEQLHYKNIIVAYANNYQLDSYGRQDVTTTGTGQGYYLTNGYALPIIWTKESRSSKTKYTYTDGTEIVLNDGNTFIQIVPSNNPVTIS